MITVKRELLRTISTVFNVESGEIYEFKKLYGSNIVYSFGCMGKKYVIRKPGYEYSFRQEKAVYDALQNMGISDQPLYFDDKGIKIAPFIDGKRLGYSKKDRADSISLLRRVHQSGITIPYPYDICGKVKNYLAACENPGSENLKKLYACKKQITALKARLDRMNITPVICHGDACIRGNYLRLGDGSLRLIDWEQAGMADPFLDIAIAALHQDFDKIAPLWCLEQYLQRKPNVSELFRLNAYIAIAAFMLAAWMINDDDGFEYYLDYTLKYQTMLNYDRGIL